MKQLTDVGSACCELFLISMTTSQQWSYHGHKNQWTQEPCSQQWASTRRDVWFYDTDGVVGHTTNGVMWPKKLVWYIETHLGCLEEPATFLSMKTTK